jgi:Sec-independent protein translocase protein TatA
VGFGTELLFVLALGLVLLGPKRLHRLLRHVARAKAEFDKVRRTIKAQLAAEIKDPTRIGETDE